MRVLGSALIASAGVQSVRRAVATGSDWSATVPVQGCRPRVIASEDACAPVNYRLRLTSRQNRALPACYNQASSYAACFETASSCGLPLYVSTTVNQIVLAARVSFAEW